MEPPRGDDAPTGRLQGLAHNIAKSLGDAVCVEQDDWASVHSVVRVRPKRADALGIIWMVFGDEVILETTGGPGGRWELELNDRDMNFLEDVVRSVVAGRVVEVRASGRSHVEVTLADGSVAAETGYAGRGSLWPKPGWKRSGRRVQYAPYRE